MNIFSTRQVCFVKYQLPFEEWKDNIESMLFVDGPDLYLLDGRSSILISKLFEAPVSGRIDYESYVPHILDIYTSLWYRKDAPKSKPYREGLFKEVTTTCLEKGVSTYIYYWHLFEKAENVRSVF